MGKKTGITALLLGAFLISLAALSKFYMYDRLAVVPFNQVSTSTSATAPGDDAEYLDVEAGLEVVTGPLRSVRVTTGDVELSKEAARDTGKDVAVWNTYSCTDTPDFDCSSGQTPLSATKDLVAFERHSAETVSWDLATSESSDEKFTDPFEGLYFKFPFKTQKKAYDFWDGTLKQAMPAQFEGEEKIDGLKVYKFVQVIEPVKSGTITVPGALVGEDEASITADRIYSNVRTLYIEPVTGTIIRGGESQDSYLEVDGERRLTTTKATLNYTDEYVAENVKEFSGKARLLNAVDSTIPIVGTLVGVLLLGFGFFALSRGNVASRRR